MVLVKWLANGVGFHLAVFSAPLLRKADNHVFRLIPGVGLYYECLLVRDKCSKMEKQGMKKPDIWIAGDCEIKNFLSAVIDRQHT